jgi:hypothetical protein
MNMIRLVVLLKGKRGQLGEIRTWNGKKYQKTPDGWKLASSIHPNGWQRKGAKKKLLYSIKEPSESKAEKAALQAMKEWGATKESIKEEYESSADEVGLTPREFINQWEEDFETFLNESQNEDLEDDSAKFEDVGDVKKVVEVGAKIVEGWLAGARPGKAMSNKEYEETYPDSDSSFFTVKEARDQLQEIVSDIKGNGGSRDEIEDAVANWIGNNGVLNDTWRDDEKTAAKVWKQLTQGIL